MTMTNADYLVHERFAAELEKLEVSDEDLEAEPSGKSEIYL